MPRPISPRRVRCIPGVCQFKPAGVPLRELEEEILTLDEVEALRLADAEGKYQEEVAEKMGVSRQTVGRILASARQKVARALVNGKAIRLEGGTVHLNAPPKGRGGNGRCRRNGTHFSTQNPQEEV